MCVEFKYDRSDPLGDKAILRRPHHAHSNVSAAPQQIIAWGRLLVAAHMLEDKSRSVDNVAHAMDYPSGSAFRNTCQRYMKRTPLEIRTSGGAPMVMQEMLAMIGGA